MEAVAQPFRFADFEVHPRAGELRRNGLRVKLARQPWEILTLMLEHPGEIVTREELRAKLWPTDTFVDFDHSLNVAINKLREALGDSPDHPRFVETVPRRGYRFIAPVEVVTRPIPPRPRRRWALAALAALLAAASYFA